MLFFFLPKDVLPNLARKENWTEGPLANKVTVYTADVGGVEESWWEWGIETGKKKPRGLICLLFWNEVSYFQAQVLLKKKSQKEKRKNIWFAACSQQLAAKLRTCPEGWAARWPLRPLRHPCAQMSSLPSGEPGQLPERRKNHYLYTMFVMDIRNGDRQDAHKIYHPN